MLKQCPKCGSEEIEIDIEAIGPELDFNDEKLQAMKLDNSVLKHLSATCNGCHSELIPTQEGYRIKD